MLYKFKKKYLVNKIIDTGRLCGEKNYTPGYSGNISARYRDGMLITTSGSANGYLTKNDIVETNSKGESLEKNKKPSSEKFLHLEIYKIRKDVNFVIHVHSPFFILVVYRWRNMHCPLQES